jgi:hypothetical protein
MDWIPVICTVAIAIVVMAAACCTKCTCSERAIEDGRIE